MKTYTTYYSQTNETFEDDYYANDCFSKDSLQGLDYLLQCYLIENSIKPLTKPFTDVMDRIVDEVDKSVNKIKANFKDMI